MNLATEARKFLRSTHSGVLSTHSSKVPGYPFGSVAPFVLDHAGQPIILISTIAEHTKNLIADPRLSLLVFSSEQGDGKQDLQANSRLTLIGEARIIEKDDADLKARYLRYLPQAAGYFDMHDFAFYRMHVQHARYIAGFGKMSWLTGEDISGAALLAAPNQLASQESGIVEHMNEDHGDSMIAYCQHVHQYPAQQAQMLGIDSDGFDVQATGVDGTTAVLRFDFQQPIYDAMSARLALVELSKASRPLPV